MDGVFWILGFCRVVLVWFLWVEGFGLGKFFGLGGVGRMFL